MTERDGQESVGRVELEEELEETATGNRVDGLVKGLRVENHAGKLQPAGPEVWKIGDGVEKRRHRLGVVGSFPDLSQTVGAERIELIALKPALEFVLVPIHRVVWYVTALVVVNEVISRIGCPEQFRGRKRCHVPIIHGLQDRFVGFLQVENLDILDCRLQSWILFAGNI